MLRLFGRMPRWLTATLSLTAAAALPIAEVFLPGLHGWHLGLAALLVVVFVLLVVGLPQLAQWQAQQESRLKVRLTAQPPELVIPAYIDDEDVITALVAAEEAACLASLPSQCAARRRGGFNAATVDDELGRAQADQELAAQAEQYIEYVDSAHRTIAEATSGLSQAILGLSRPETRTVEQYQDEVRRYLSAYEEFLLDHLLDQYVEQDIGLLRLTLENPTDHVFDDVQVELYLPGAMKAIDPRDLPDDTSSQPARPRPFGTSSPALAFDLPGAVFARNIEIPSAFGYAPVIRPRIDNSGSARVTYPPVLLRAGAREPLDDLVLIAKEPPSSVIAATWEASATNADGRVSDHLTVRVTAPIPIRELLASIAARRP